MRIFHIDSPLTQKLSLLFDLMVLNLLTILCSLPIVTAGAAVSALYDAIWRLRQNQGTLLRNYFRAFRDSGKQATFLLLPLLAIGLVFGYNALLVAAPVQFLEFSVLWMLLWFAGAAYLNLIMLTKSLERLTELSQVALEPSQETEESDDITL